jgi:hypothetical protein
MMSPKDARRLAVYRRMLECFRLGMQLRGNPVEWVEIPYDGTSLPALFVPADRDGPAPCMIHFDGLDVMKELIYLSGLPGEFRRRGISTLIVDHPAVGEALRLRLAESAIKNTAETASIVRLMTLATKRVRNCQISVPGSAPSGTIDWATAVHRCSGPHANSCGTDTGRYGSCDRPRPQRDARPHDATGRVVNVLAIHHGFSWLHTCEDSNKRC